MKKHVTLMGLLALATNFTFSQNIIVGSNMEATDESSWTVTTLETDASNSSEYVFGYTDDAPFAGNGACLHYTITNSGANGAHLMFYQAVTIEKGKKYIADMAAKAIQTMNNSWFEVYLGEVEPADGADYGTGAIALGGFKWSGWEAGCADLDLFDGTLQNDGCMAHSQDTIFIEGEGTALMYFGFKAGIWATATTVEFVVDNVSLTEVGSSTINENGNLTNTIYPNPAINMLNIANYQEVSQVSIINVIGQEVIHQDKPSATIDISTLKTGVYLVKLIDVAKHQSFIKLQKN